MSQWENVKTSFLLKVPVLLRVFFLSIPSSFFIWFGNKSGWQTAYIVGFYIYIYITLWNSGENFPIIVISFALCHCLSVKGWTFCQSSDTVRSYLQFIRNISHSLPSLPGFPRIVVIFNVNTLPVLPIWENSFLRHDQKLYFVTTKIIIHSLALSDTASEWRYTVVHISQHQVLQCKP